MSLETLLEAAEFLEWRNHSRTRDSSPRDPHGYSVLSTNDSDGSPESSNSGKLSGNEDGKDKRRSGGAGTREVHNKLEKNRVSPDQKLLERKKKNAGAHGRHKKRRAHLKECFEFLKNQIPTLEDKRTSNLSILRGSLRYIQALRRKEKEYELEMQRLAREKISLQERMTMLKLELARMNIEVDINQWGTLPDDQDSNSTSTATEQGSPICSEGEEEDDEGRPLYSVHEVKSNKPMQRSLPHPIMSQPSMTVMKVGNPSPAPARTHGNNTTSKVPIMTSSTVTMPTIQTTGSVIQQTLAAAAVRPPVTQILARQLLQRQQSGTSQGALQVSSTMTTSASSLGKIQTVKSVAQMRAPLTLGSFSTTPANAAQLAALNKLAGTAALSIPMASINSATNITPLTQALNQPILMSPNLQLATPVTSVITGTSQVSAVTTITTASASLMSLAAMQNGMATTMVSPATNVNAATINSIRPTIIGAGPHHAIMTAPLAALIPQTVPRTTIANLPAGMGNMVGHNSMQQLISLAQMGQATGGAHLVSPMAVMSPNVQLAASGLSQSQINSLMASQHLLKQIPIFSPGLLQGGQMIGQPVVKPFVVVTVPSVVPTTSASNVVVTTSST